MGIDQVLLQLAAVAIGGSAGSVLRYGITRKFPFVKPILWGVFAVNFIGCFLICFIFFKFANMEEIMRLLVFTGFFGGFTTMSSVSLEMVQYWRKDPAKALAIFIFSSAVCIAAGFLGRGLAIAI